MLDYRDGFRREAHPSFFSLEEMMNLRGRRDVSVEYDIAQICMNGHVVNRGMRQMPGANQNCCSKCGAPTIHKCQQCQADINGNRLMSGPGGSLITFDQPAYCPKCGTAYPWIVSKIEVAKLLIQETDGLEDAEKEKLAGSIDDLVKESPRTQLAATRLKKAAGKIGVEGLKVLKDTISDIVSNTVKELLWPTK
jgi:hypothetical protein